MSNINAKRAGYFEGHKDAKELFFVTIDGIDKGYHTENAARNSIGNAKNVDVEKISRPEAEEWLAANPQTVDHEVTQEDLDKNPSLGEQGIKVGDVIQIPVDDTQSTAEEIAEDVKKAATKKVVKKVAKKK